MAEVKRPPIEELLHWSKNAIGTASPYGPRVKSICKWALELERRAAALCDALGTQIYPTLVSDWPQDCKIRDSGLQLRALLDQVPKEGRK